MDIINFKTYEFIHCLNELASVVPKKTSNYIVCKFIAVTFKDGQAILTGTNAQVQISIKANATHSKSPQNFLFHFDKVFSIAKRSKDCETITFSVDEKKKLQLQFDGINATYKLNTMNYDEFIWLQSEKLDHKSTLPCLKVHSSIAKTAHIKNKGKDIKSALKGVHLYIQESDILAVSTDGHRLALYSTSVEQSTFTKKPVIIPDDAAEMLMKACANYLENEVTLGYSESTFKAVVANTQIVFSLHGGLFPDLRSIIPNDLPYHAIIQRQDLVAALKTLGTISADDRFSKISFEFGKESVTIRAINTIKEEGEVDMPISGKNDFTDVGVAHNYVSDAITSMTGEEVKLSYNEPSTAIKITDVGTENHINVIMPMR